MIGRIHGTLVHVNPPDILVDAHGVGYEISVPMSTLYDLPPAGQPVTLVTHLVVREDAQLLYGFLTEGERTAFRALIKVSGIGPRMALAVLSGLSVDDLSRAVAEQETGRLTRVPGVGKKTAERLLLELKGKLAPVAEAAQGGGGVLFSSSGDILRALVALGYSEKESAAAVSRLPEDISVKDGIRQALKGLGKN
ncbi:Holliday junction branch migration protein RuvA [Lautropia dentalis]|uniref:Holliday junction branch migration complex subunit RuvA n=1 Tax=Lautropia dentalis TaxID=2490857 RepID=A0A426FP11_9BURK|nr:Holliday junction branch migration protein RuvA [Lautropia dentalis]RRN44409.1 Holliday junction branch migration protein RuvA [Lautropia dentalis]